MRVIFKQAIDAGSDVLLIGGVLVEAEGVESAAPRGVDAEGAESEEPVPEPAERPCVARGWVSALTNHFAPEAYWTAAECPAELGEAAREEWLARWVGHRKDDATPRAMTDAEAREYCQRLLDEQCLPGAAQPAPQTLLVQPLEA